jgi:hypothetical protein
MTIWDQQIASCYGQPFQHDKKCPMCRQREYYLANGRYASISD